MQRRLLTGAASALLFVTAITAAACGGGGDEGATDAGSEPSERPLSDAVALYSGGTQPTCQTCHGTNGAGAMMGPSIDALADHWDTDTLTAFLLDPPAHMAESQRLNELASRYPMPMPKPSGFTESDARVLARWLLAGMPR